MNVIDIQNVIKKDIKNLLLSYHKTDGLTDKTLGFRQCTKSQGLNPPNSLRVIANSISDTEYVYNTDTNHVYGVYDSKGKKFYYNRNR